MAQTHVQRNAETRTSVMLVIGRYGIPEPQIEVTLPKGAHYRQVRAAVHALAAKVEEASEREAWCVTVDVPTGEGKGRVYLELARNDKGEAERGLALLAEVTKEKA